MSDNGFDDKDLELADDSELQALETAAIASTQLNAAQFTQTSIHLKAEKDHLEQELRSKQGEISILRSNAQRTKDQYNRSLQETLLKLQQSERNAAEKISSLQCEIDRLQTEAKFHAGEIKLKLAKPTEKPSLEHGDFLSKASFEQKETVGLKRKRSNSPEPPPQKSIYSAEELRALLDRLLHVSVSNQICLEALHTWFLPSDSRSLANIFWQAILTSSNTTHSPFSTIISHLLHLWNECISQHIFDPLVHICQLLSFAFINMQDEVIPDEVYSTLANSFQLTLEPYTLARMKGNSYALKQDHLIPIFECVLQAVSAIVPYHLLIQFWQVLRIDFILMLLNSRQDIEIVHETIKLLKSSILDDEFGPPCNAHVRLRHTNLLLEASTRLLAEPASSSKLDIVDFLFLIAFSGKSGVAYLFNSNQVIPRLVKHISAELDAINNQIDVLESSVALVKKAVQTLHAIVTIHNPEHLALKLASSPGAIHAHIESMTRISFAMDNLTDISDLSRDLLELTVSPEEGDAIFELFNS